MEQIWWVQGFSDVSVVKNLPASARDLGLIPGSGRSPDQEDPLEKEMQSTPEFLLEEPHGQRNLVGYSPWGHQESDMT